MKKTFLSFVLLGSLAFAQDSNLLSSQELSGATLASDGHKQTFREKMLEKELKLQVPRETVPVEAINYPIKSPIPKTAEYLPMLQTLLHIEAGTLPNPIGVSVIGSFTQENYRVTKFNGQMGANLGKNISNGLNNIVPNNLVVNGLLFGNQGILWKGGLLQSPSKNRENFFKNLQEKLDQSFGNGTKEWTLSDGSISTRTGAVGIKADVWVFPFMQLFVSGTYLHMEQETNVGNATIPLDTPLNPSSILTGTITTTTPSVPNNPQLEEALKKAQAFLKSDMSSITFPVGTIRNVLDGWAVMGGTNLAIGYKGFFLSCMIGGGYVKLDDLANNVKGFVKKPFMYIAPRIGYSLGGVFTAHFGVQRIELFGSTSGNDLSASTGGLVQGYSVDIEKYPVNFLVGTSFTPMRDLGISFEYVTSPDTKGLNAEIAYRF